MIRVFISHSWSYDEHYNKLKEWIFEEKWHVGGQQLTFLDLSVPRENPIHFASNDLELKTAIDARIIDSDVIVIPTGLYANYSKWINKEIESSILRNKPILAVRLYAAERQSSIVLQNCSKEVSWMSEKIVGGIYDLYRGY